MEVLYTDKSFNNPVLGKVNCCSFKEIFAQCEREFKSDRNDLCQ